MKNDPIRVQIRAALSSVSDSYDDFVEGLDYTLSKYPDYQEPVLEWLKLHPEANSSTVIRYVVELLPGFLEKNQSPPCWFEKYTDEELQQYYGYKNKAEAAADTPGTPEYEARMREEADADDMDDGDEGLTEME